MKNVITAILLLLTATGFSQIPQLVNFQGIARTSDGKLFNNKKLVVRLSIINEKSLGVPIYSETKKVQTNELGIFSVIIGDDQGEYVSGSIKNIDWSTGNKFIQLEADAYGNGNFEFLGTSQLLSVPYALYAFKSGSSTGVAPNVLSVNCVQNGLELTAAGCVQLGNDVGGTAATLLNNRDIPMNNFFLQLSNGKLQFNNSFTSGGKELIRFNSPTGFTGNTPFQMIQFASNNGDGTYNEVVKWGHNIDGAFNNTKTGLYYSMEPHWISGGTEYQEAHLEISLPSEPQKLRLFSSTFQNFGSYATSINQWDFRATNFSVKNLSNLDYATFAFDKNSGNSQIVFKTNLAANSGIAFQHVNNAGTAEIWGVNTGGANGFRLSAYNKYGFGTLEYDNQTSTLHGTTLPISLIANSVTSSNLFLDLTSTIKFGSYKSVYFPGETNSFVGNASGIGILAGAGYNTGIGWTALAENTSGNNNTAIGSFAGRGVTTGSNNVFIGYKAGYSGNTGHTNSVVIGNLAATSVGTLTNTLWIQSDVTTASSTPLVRGDFSTKRLGINLSTAPTETLEVGGNEKISGDIKIDGGLKVLTTGSNHTAGTITLTSGTATILTNKITANSIVILTGQDNNVLGSLRTSSRTAGTSFVVTSSNSSDSGKVAWMIIETY